MIAKGIRFKHIQKDIRFNGGYFLNEDALNSLLLEESRDKCVQLDALAKVWNPPIFKRQFCQKTKNSVSYCQSSDVSKALEGSDVYINKRQAISVGSVVAENQILVTGFGTIGNTRLVNELSAGTSYANNVCRIQANSDVPYGYLYAFLSSQYGRSQLNKNASGSVVRYIEAPGIKKTLIPILSESKQQQIHNLIVEASKLRVEANKLLRQRIAAIETKMLTEIDPGSQHRVGRRSIKEINLFEKRLDAPYNAGIGRNIHDQIVNQRHIRVKGVAQVFHPILFGKKQIKGSAATGNQLYKSSSMVRLKPETDFWLSRNKIESYKKLQVENGWVLISRTGTVGNIVRIGKAMHNTFLDDHMIRLKPKPEYEGLVYFYLKSFYGQRLIEFQKYGSVQEVINSEYIELIPIPEFLLEPNFVEELNSAVRILSEKTDTAFEKEANAIALVEKEIESWQE